MNDILSADSVTLKFDNQKNGWKGVCESHEANGDLIFCPDCALGCHFLHIHDNVVEDWTVNLSEFFMNGI